MNIEILSTTSRDPGLKITRIVAEKFISHNCRVFAPLVNSAVLPSGVFGESCPNTDLIVVLGGDGSIMRAAHRAGGQKCPILGINLGHLGYLTEIDTNELDYIDCIFSNEYSVEKRTMLDVAHIRKNRKLGRTAVALNDAVLTHGKTARILDIEVMCDGLSLGKYRSDGFIVATPTGSTAYSLSAGGPVLDPRLNGICLVPICPHSLTARPLIVPDSSRLELKYLGHGGMTCLTVDGEEIAEFEPGDSVTVNRSENTANFVRFDKKYKRNFYTTLKYKMSEI